MRGSLKAISLSALAFAGALAFGQFESQGVRLLSNIPLSAFPGAPTSGSGGSGYVSPSGREYACFGVRNGVNVVDITNPTAPVVVGHVDGPSSTWHESAVLGDYLYMVADGVNQGMHIIDLRMADQGIVTLAGTYTGNNLQRVHTIQANAEKRYLYLNGSNISNGGLVILDVTTPTAPVQVGAWSTRYVHDSQIVNYTSGPYAGKEIAFLCCGGAGLYIVDVTNKQNMVTLDSIDYIGGSNYCHSGSLTADGRYFLVNDEFDEGNGLVPTCTTHIIDVSDLSNITYVGPYTNNGDYIDHNSQRVNDLLFLAAYRGGLRIYDMSAAPNLTELGYFDTYPGSGMSYTGAWGVQTGFPSGNVAIYDINRGLFVLDPSEAIGLGAPLTAVNVVLGTHVAGGIADIRQSDAREHQARFSVSPSNDDNPEIALQVLAESTVTPSALLDVRIEARETMLPRAVARVFLRNWSSNQYELVGTFDVFTAESTGQFTSLDGSKYVSSTGQIDMRMNVTPGPESEPAAFGLFTDLVKFTVRRS